MNRVPTYLLEESSGVWHRPDTLKLPRAGGIVPLCGEAINAIAHCYGESRHIELLCHACEEEFERRQKGFGR